MLFEISGNHGDLGFAHGKLLALRIHRTLDFYFHLFGIPEAELCSHASGFKQAIQQQVPQYIDELEGIAEGAGVPPWQIYALNSRSEILSMLTTGGMPGECTSLYFADSRALGQNWDWSEHLEPLMCVLKMRNEQGREILTLTEPGMLAKTGLNDQGLGVCLNILQAPVRQFGVPVHVCLRMALDSGLFTPAREALVNLAPGKASHILLADALGNSTGIEYDDEGAHLLAPENEVLIHTNHYLAHDRLDSIMPTTHERVDTAARQVQEMEEKAPETMAEFLLDKSPDIGAAFQEYHHDEALNSLAPFGAVGTVMTVVMNLQERSMRLRPASETKFLRYRL